MEQTDTIWVERCRAYLSLVVVKGMVGACLQLGYTCCNYGGTPPSGELPGEEGISWGQQRREVLC